MGRKTNRAFIVVDVQNDFCPGGALAVPKGDEVVPVINRLVGSFPTVIFTMDWHPENHCSFKEYGGIWPRHCVEYTAGAKLHAGLLMPSRYYYLAQKCFRPDMEAYSGFHETGLEKIIKHCGIHEVFICGLATDYCVKATAIHAKKLCSFDTFVIIDACRGMNVTEGDVDRAVEEMRTAGIEIITSKEV